MLYLLQTEEEMVVEYVPVEYVAPVQRITCDLMSLDEMVSAIYVYKLLTSVRDGYVRGHRGTGAYTKMGR